MCNKINLLLVLVFFLSLFFLGCAQINKYHEKNFGNHEYIKMSTREFAEAMRKEEAEKRGGSVRCIQVGPGIFVEENR